MTTEYNIEVIFKHNQLREEQKSKLEIDSTIEVSSRDGALFMVEVLKELAYGECTSTLVATDEAQNNLGYVDYFLLDRMFNTGHTQLVQDFMDEFEIEKLVINNGERDIFAMVS